jgi:hypothetical protein
LDAYVNNTIAVPVTSYDELVLDELQRLEFEEYAKRVREGRVGDRRVFQDDYDDDDNTDNDVENEDGNLEKPIAPSETGLKESLAPSSLADGKTTSAVTRATSNTAAADSTDSRGVGSAAGEDCQPESSSLSSNQLIVLEPQQQNNNSSLSEAVKFLQQLPLQITLIGTCYIDK